MTISYNLHPAMKTSSDMTAVFQSSTLVSYRRLQLMSNFRLAQVITRWYTWKNTDKTETPAPGSDAGALDGRGFLASRASEKAPQGLFPPPDYSAGRCCSNPPLKAKLQILCKTKIQCISTLDFLVERSNLNPNHCPLGHLWRRFHRKWWFLCRLCSWM